MNKTIFKSTFALATLAMSLALIGCVQFPTTTRTMTYAPKIPQGQVIEAAIEVARDLQFPPATKIDKQNGIVEFGSFGIPVIGLTAQVRIPSDGKLEITVKRGSDIYHPAGKVTVEEIDEQFKSKLAERLATAGK